VPLLDLDGSTIGLVNAAQVDSGPVTTYTYDPSGNPTATGTPNDWPFQYKGMEKEFTDPAPYYYSGSGQFYSPQLVRSLSETGQTSSSGTGGGPSPSQLAYGPGSQGNGSFGHWLVNNVLDPSSTGNQLGNLPDIGFSSETASYVIPLGEIARIIEEWVSFFEWLFGGGGAPQIPRQLRHGRHPLYPDILGVLFGLIPTEASAMLVFSASGATPPNVPPLLKPGYMTVQFHGYNYCGPGNNGGPTTPGTLDDCCRQHDNCYDQGQLSSNNVLPGHPGAGARSAQTKCDQVFCDCMRFSAPIGLSDRFLRYFAEGQFCY
jgi:hypothetical protein